MRERSQIAIGLAVSAALFAGSIPARAQWCASPYLVEWPVGDPLWTLCWVPPDASHGPDGSGIELRHVFFKGKRVLWKASMPVLNVLYDEGSGACGPTYRDWLNSLEAFEADNVVSPGYAEPTTTPKTVCDAPGADVGSFAGVAVEKLSDRLVLTTQASAGWYRYIQRITFTKDGTIEPLVGFTAVQHPCVVEPHTHHGYWRFDTDIDGAADDSIQERRYFLWFGYWQTLSTETSRLRKASGSRRWRTVDGATGRGLEIRPGHHDPVGGDPFGGSDFWALQHRGTETDDGGATGGALGDAQHLDDYVNGESLVRSDVVAWYRVSHRHDGGLSCLTVGPELRLVGSW